MADLTVQKVSLTGTAPVFSAAGASGDTFINNGRTYLYIKNGGTSAVTVTIESRQPCNYGFDHDVQVSVPAGGERIIGPFAKERFNDSNQKVSVTYSAVTSVTVAAITD